MSIHAYPETAFSGTHQQTCSNIYEFQLLDFMGKNNRAIQHCAPPLPSSLIMLGCLPVLSLTANFRVHARVTFLVCGDERPLLKVCFLKRLKTSLFHWRWFGWCTINRLSHTFPRAQNVSANVGLILELYLACSFADVLFSKLQKIFFRLQLSGCSLQETSEKRLQLAA